jgi:hypothetical protein
MVHGEKLAGNSRDDQIWQLGDRLSSNRIEEKSIIQAAGKIS